MKKRLIPFILVALVLAVVACILAFKACDGGPVAYERVGSDDNIVEINGKQYVERPNVDKYLLFGIDDYSKDAKEDAGGQCDVIRLLAIDRAANTYANISISRDTLAQIYSYDKEGNALRATETQMAFAHTHGFTREQHAQGVIDSVSNLLFGIKINKYMGFYMDAVPRLNHLAGGVSVTLSEDFSGEDPAMVKGATIKLSDEQAEIFVRGRMNVGDGTNRQRMGRQQQFLDELLNSFRTKYSEDAGFAGELFEEMDQLSETNMSKGDFSKIAKAAFADDDLGTFEITGEYGKDDNGYVTLKPDDSLSEIAIELLYDPVE